MKRYEIEDLHEKLFGYNAFEDLDFGEKASEVRRYIKGMVILNSMITVI